jgi:UDP-N-acetylglucosamine--N-acetylmuramyl-(pentapeptide) pyrophosphoryl-undecaprenol N-acetylglucosamine transferase
MSESTKFYVVTAGGTGGHLFPARALGSELTRRGHMVILITDKRAETIVSTFRDMVVFFVPSGTFANAGFKKKLRAAWDIFLGTLESRGLYKKMRPEAVIGFGGYPSVPAMLAAKLSGIPICIHEQNAVMGRANARLAPWASAVALSFEGTRGFKAKKVQETVVTGNPVRAEIAALRDKPYPEFGPDTKFRLLVFGGSQGAKILTSVVPAALSHLPPALRARMEVTQQCHEEDKSVLEQKYAEAGIAATVASFFHDIPALLADTHLVIGRAGASTVCELAAAGRPGILVPLPSSLRDEQTANAMMLAGAGGGWLIPQAELTDVELAKRILKLATTHKALEDAAADAKMVGRPEAASALADLVEKIVAEATNSDGAVAASGKPALSQGSRS